MPKPSEDMILVGTRKGAFIFRSRNGRRSWKMSGPIFEGSEVFHMAYDSRNKLLLASVNNFQWGPRVMRSRDFGETWKESKKHPRYPKGSGLSVEQIWHIEPGTERRPDRLFAGVAPAGLFVSDDGGDTWRLNQGLLQHPTRKKWTPGAGGLCLHSIQTDPKHPKALHIGISAVGVLRTEDGGKSWDFQNKHVRAGFLPDKYPVYGQCVHKLLRVGGDADTLVQMNHCGVFRTTSNGKDWTEITDNFPSTFGFSIALDPNDKSKIYAIPEEADVNRIPPKGRFAVWTRWGGEPWSRLTKGLPSRGYFGTYREGMANDLEDPTGVYFGTNTGQLYATRSAGESWSRITEFLPPILSVTAAAT